MLAALLCGCGSPERATGGLADSDPYIQALYAMMNLNGCKQQRRANPRPADLAKTEELIARAAGEFASVEAAAKSRGHADYVQRAHIDFAQRIEEELHALCDPDEQAASKRASDAIARLRAHLASLPQTH